MITIRQARPGDRGPLAEMMYSAGPEMYEFAFLYRLAGAGNLQGRQTQWMQGGRQESRAAY